jgi:hypothetical protein
MPRLQRLELSDCGVTDKGVAVIVDAVPALKYLNLNHCCDVTEAGQKYLAKLHYLEVLQLDRAPSRNREKVTQFSLLTKLKELNVCFSDLPTDAALKLSGCRDLQILDISLSTITDQGLKHISRLPALTHLDLTTCEKLTDVGFLEVGKIVTLQVLKLAFTSVTDEGLSGLTNLPRLTALDLEGCDELSEDCGQELRDLVAVKKLNLDGCYSVADTTLQDLSYMPSLTALSISSDCITDKGLLSQPNQFDGAQGGFQ